ncbi:fumarylacetoacetate hydrolase family protein [Caballeronia grimmiae]|uniref:2-hydroxyhepta-2,4-diene-1,7-dioate isomerase n=1 Tax=Caballeronia grimmiae TaxID=1071679 RepID=A0A069NUS7_9BURK|nr:fumarylacetoacetate hydrolase family protein [Caballeronia grimmiae]KDR32148.1 2-hydroxyhepta-2,4-diene-1,7-dioate isomerase [Caballeronia grimmiae]GGD78736.1 2-hydroxyhepta-2,4-diene-1,7-dioate isomerase [Caballeronia grimmiae]
MKLVRHGQAGQERPGIIDAQGQIRDLGDHCKDFDPAFFAGDGLRQLKTIDLQSLPLVGADTRLGPCVARPGTFLAIGLNYVQHAIETNAPIPTDPIIFSKAPSCVSGPNDPVLLPKGSTKTDWEVELAFVVGKRAHYVEESEALDYIAGYFICNDVSEREFQLERSGQWQKGKMFPTFGPIGPWLVTSDEIADVQNLGLWLELNGKRIQNSSTSDMIFSIAKILSDTSQYVALEPGDIITTGTPPGVGLGMKPEAYLKPGDVMRLGVEGLGVQEQRVVRWGEQ